MGQQILSQQDCFLYFPTLHAGEGIPQNHAAKEGTKKGIPGEKSSSPLLRAVDDTWIKIPLVDKIVVYAHTWE